MSFATSINTLLNSNTSINNAVSGIYYEILPDNASITASNVVYRFQLTDSIDILEKNNEIDIFILDIFILSPDSNTIDTITGLFRTFLDNYDTSLYKDIKLENIELAYEGERAQFINNMTYKITFQN
jgi:hypothetical protein